MWTYEVIRAVAKRAPPWLSQRGCHGAIPSVGYFSALSSFDPSARTEKSVPAATTLNTAFTVFRLCFGNPLIDLNGLGIQPGVLAHCRVQLIFLARFFLHTFRICPHAKEQHLEGAGLGIAALPALRGGR